MNQSRDGATVPRYRARITPEGGSETLNWHVLGPGEPALGEWEALGLDLPDQDVIRRYRLDRVREQLARFDYAGIVLFDPLNVRYATDSTNMQVWILHNAARYCFVPTDGPVVLFEFPSAAHLSDHLPLVSEVRPATPWYYFGAGPKFAEQAQRWADEIADLVRRHGGGNSRLASDRMNAEGVAALGTRGVSVHNGEEVMELARVIKHPEEIKAMRCAIAAAEAAMSVMQDALVPGITEQRLWAYLHAESIARGGEWIETRLLSSGPRTNPWYQECSSRVIEDGDLVAFDTDLIGSYGACVDISRTWVCGDRSPSPNQRQVFELAAEQIRTNTELLQPGTGFKELAWKAHVPDHDLYRRYTVLYHGVGLCDEYPGVCFRDQWDDIGYDGVMEPGMVMCVESFVGRRDGGEGVKLEEQVLVTEKGPETLSTYPLGLVRS